MKLIDLTQTFDNQTPVWPEDTQPEIRLVDEFAKDGLNMAEIETGLHVGTHMDAPLHMIDQGKKMSEMPIEKFFGRGVLVDARGKKKIDLDVLKGEQLKSGDIVLVWTEFSQKFKDKDYFTNYPVVTEDFAQQLIQAKVSLLGMDMPSPDYEPFPTHRLLLQQEILIIENLTNLDSLDGVSDFQVMALPLKLAADAALARVVALVN